MKAVLADHSAGHRAALLRSHLSTPWVIACLGNIADYEHARSELADADAFVGNAWPAELRGAGPRLKLVHCVGAGVDLVEPRALPPGCLLCNVHEHETPIAEYVMLNVLLAVTRLAKYQARFRQGEWMGSGRCGGEFHGEAAGRTLGLIGLGHIGRAVARRALAFGMWVIAVAPDPPAAEGLAWCGGPDRLDELLAESDFVVVACPLTETSRGMLGPRELRLIKPAAHLINVARAEIVQEAALYEALRDRWFAGAALDVWYQYPCEPGQRAHGSRYPFHELDNVVVTPHLAAWTSELIERRYRRIAENLDRLAQGRPLERVVCTGTR